MTWTLGYIGLVRLVKKFTKISLDLGWSKPTRIKVNLHLCIKIEMFLCHTMLDLATYEIMWFAGWVVCWFGSLMMVLSLSGAQDPQVGSVLISTDASSRLYSFELELIHNGLNNLLKCICKQDKHMPMTLQAMAFYISYLCNHNITTSGMNYEMYHWLFIFSTNAYCPRYYLEGVYLILTTLF